MSTSLLKFFAQQRPKSVFVSKAKVFHFCTVLNSARAKFRPMDTNFPITAQIYRIAVRCLMALLILPGAGASAQGWELAFGGNKEDQGQAIVQSRDGGFMLAGFSESFGADNDLDIFVIKTDVDGRIQWQRVIDEGFIEKASAILPARDNGYLIAGDYKRIPDEALDGYLVKIDDNGELIWSRLFGGDKDDQLFSVQLSEDGGYILTGKTASYGDGRGDMFLVKTDRQGLPKWIKNFGNPTGEDEGREIAVLSDGYLVMGNTYNSANQSNDIGLWKVDFNGNQVWFKTFGTDQPDYGYGMVANLDGTVTVAGYSGFNSDITLLKIDANGAVRWWRTTGGPLADQAYDLIQTQDGGYAVTGITEVNETNINIALIKYDNNGQVMWSKNLGNSDQVDYGQSLVSTEDGGFAIVGYNSLYTALVNDLTLVKTNGNGDTYSVYIRGNVFKDSNLNCRLNTGEAGLENWLIRAESAERTFVATTDADGKFSILVDTGEYQVSLLRPNPYWQPCVDDYKVRFRAAYDSVSFDFPVQDAVSCPLMQVDVSGALSYCDDVRYQIDYCNEGTATARNAYVEITLDSSLSFLSASLPIANQDGRMYTFRLGDVAAGACGKFQLAVRSACEGFVVGKATSVKAHIYPDTSCLLPSPDWDGASVVVGGSCDEDGVSFFIKNDGEKSMSQARRYFVVEDIVMARQEPFQLEPEEQLDIQLPAGGATYRLIAEQVEGHPGNSYPTVAIEGCVVDPDQATTGIVTLFEEDDKDPFVAIDVQEAIPNSAAFFMRGYPKGYGDDNYIRAETDLSYILRFQNNTSDTITRLVIRDTLSPYFDLNSLEMGASTHPYSFELYSNGVLKITFTDIRLLSSSVDAVGSQGFIKFRISQKPNNPTGTQLRNRAAVYYNFEAPVLTNEVQHTVGGELTSFVITGIDEPAFPDLNVRVYPNPFTDSAIFEWQNPKTDEPGAWTFSIFDVQGRMVRRELVEGNALVLTRQGLPAGLYVYRLEYKGQLANTGKIIAR